MSGLYNIFKNAPVIGKKIKEGISTIKSISPNVKFRNDESKKLIEKIKKNKAINKRNEASKEMFKKNKGDK